MSRRRILILGGGIAGLSTAWSLSRTGGAEVVLVEREPTLGAQSTGRSAAILRSALPDPALRELALAGSRFLRAPPAGFAPVPLVDPVGVLIAADARRAGELAAWQRALDGRVRARIVAPDEARSLAPHWSGPLDVALHLPDEGRIDVAALVEGFAAGARERGVAIRTGASASALLASGGAVRGARLESGEELLADTTVIAAGGWAGRLAAAAGSPVEARPTRRHLLVTELDARVDPRWPVVWSLHDEFYARPESGGLLLCACDESDVDPDRCVADPAVREAIAAGVARSLPDFAGAGAAHFWCGMRTFATDHRFLIGFDPVVAGLFWVAGLGGHGLSCSPAVGELAAELCLAGASRHPSAAACDPARFAAPQRSGR